MANTIDSAMIQAACQYVNEGRAARGLSLIGPSDIVGSTLDIDNLVILVDLGIKGIPKYHIPNNELLNVLKSGMPSASSKPATKKKPPSTRRKVAKQ